MTMIKRFAKLGMVACMAALAACVLAGCLGANTQVDDPNKQYRTYMSQVNQIMVELDESLVSFTEAVSRNDVVNVGSQLDQALKTLDQLESIEVPDSMKDIHKSYKDAADTLSVVLREYTKLYTEIDAAAQGGEVDWSSYEDRMADLQKQYSEGIAGLQAADDAAAKAGAF